MTSEKICSFNALLSTGLYERCHDRTMRWRTDRRWSASQYWSTGLHVVTIWWMMCHATVQWQTISQTYCVIYSGSSQSMYIVH